MYSRKLPKNSYEEFFYKVNYFFSYLSPNRPSTLLLCVCVEERSLGNKPGLLKVRVSPKIRLPDTKESWGTQHSIEEVISS